MKKFKTIKKLIKILIYLIAVVVIVAMIFLIIGVSKCATSQFVMPPETQQTVATPTNIANIESSIGGYHRPESSTYLTFPEWYIVYSSQEYAKFLTNNLPSGFPYFSSIRQYWYGYCAVYSLTKNQYAMNWGDHLMLVVIGSSLSIEYTMKGIYENTIGWLSEWSSSYHQTQEDHYADKVAQQYAEFIPYQPWFEFSFMNSLRGLWTQNDLFGPYMLRKWERKGILSVEYILKAGYSSLIALGSHSTYGTVSQDTYLLMKNVPDAVFNTVFKNGARVRMVRKVGDHEYIATIPHEQAFTDIVPVLALNGVQFEDVAGNHSILVSAVTPPGWAAELNEGTILFKMNVLTQPYTKRIVIEVPVDQLSYLLVQLVNSGATIEHIYDY